MKLFLDTSVLLSASLSASGASRELFRIVDLNQWVLLTSPYVINECAANLHRFNPDVFSMWQSLLPRLQKVDDVLSLNKPVVFEPAKDRPILFTALAWADILLTLDYQDFGSLMNSSFYGMRIIRPGAYLLEERLSGRLKS